MSLKLLTGHLDSAVVTAMLFFHYLVGFCTSYKQHKICK